VAKPPASVIWGIASSTRGKLVIGLTRDGAFCRISFMVKKNGRAEKIVEAWRKKWPRTEFSRNDYLAGRAARNAFFCGKKIKTLLAGTAFQRLVWKELLKIPHGRTISYSELARRIGKPKAVRAAGNALGANPVPVIVPCHRVIASGGKIGGFSAGKKIKRELLAEENILFSMR